MNATNVGYLVQLAFIVGAALFVIGLHLMNSPATARTGNRLSAVGMIVAVSAEVVFVAQNGMGLGNWAIIIAGLALGGGLGLRMARTVAMTSMPQLVSLFNAVGGGAAALLALSDFIALDGHRVLAGGAPVCITVTHLDGLVLARSTFSHSANFRSVVILGHGRLVTDTQEKVEALRIIVEQVVPGRSAEARGPNEKELASTMVVALTTHPLRSIGRGSENDA